MRTFPLLPLALLAFVVLAPLGSAADEPTKPSESKTAAAPAQPPKKEATRPPDPKQELAELRVGVRKIMIGSYVFVQGGGNCALLPCPDSPDRLTFRNEKGHKATFVQDANDPYRWDIVSSDPGTWDPDHCALVHVDPTGVSIRWVRKNGEHRSDWVSVRK
jgi:hypothetical protein